MDKNITTEIATNTVILINRPTHFEQPMTVNTKTKTPAVPVVFTLLNIRKTWLIRKSGICEWKKKEGEKIGGLTGNPCIVVFL